MTTIGHGIATLFLLILVLSRYAKVIMKRTFTKKDRVMPWHIITISLSYFLSTIFICMAMIERIGLDKPVSWRVPLGFIAFFLGDMGLMFIASYMKEELNHIRRF
jgi:uncharacterized BrkB/YihY/UPF0761 family membrane protein